MRSPTAKTVLTTGVAACVHKTRTNELLTDTAVNMDSQNSKTAQEDAAFSRLLLHSAVLRQPDLGDELLHVLAICVRGSRVFESKVFRRLLPCESLCSLSETSTLTQT